MLSSAVSRAQSAAKAALRPLAVARRCYTPDLTPEQFAAQHPAPARPKNVLFFGTSGIAVPTLERLAAARDGPNPVVGKLEVVVPPHRGVSKSDSEASVAQAAAAMGIPIHTVTPGTNFKMDGWDRPAGDFDVGVVISFGHMLPARVIDSFPMGMINAHASLLPYYKGAAPIQRALLHGDAVTGVSVISLHPTKMDAGRVFSRTTVPIPAGATFGDMCGVLGPVAADAVVAVLADWRGASLGSREQGEIVEAEGAPPEHCVRARKITKDMGAVQWGAHSATEVARLWQALTPSVAVFARLTTGRRVILHGVQPAAAGVCKQALARLANAAPGTLSYCPQSKVVLVACRDGTVAQVSSLQFETKKAVPAETFASGLALGKPTTQLAFEAATPV